MSSDTFDKLKAKLAEVEALLSVTQKALKASEEDRVKVEAERERFKKALSIERGRLNTVDTDLAVAREEVERLKSELEEYKIIAKDLREANRQLNLQKEDAWADRLNVLDLTVADLARERERVKELEAEVERLKAMDSDIKETAIQYASRTHNDGSFQSNAVAFEAGARWSIEHDRELTREREAVKVMREALTRIWMTRCAWQLSQEIASEALAKADEILKGDK